MKFTVSALLLLGSLTFVCPLCTPPQWEGIQEISTSYASISQHGLIDSYVLTHYDFTNKRSSLNVSTNESGKVSFFNILTIYKDGKGVQYTSRYYPYESCVKRNLTKPFEEKCVPEFSTAAGNFFFAEPGFMVKSYVSYTEDLTTKYDVYEKSGETMVPLMESMKGTIGQNDIFQTIVFKNITGGIKDTHIFEIPADCEEGKPGEPWLNEVGLSFKDHFLLRI